MPEYPSSSQPCCPNHSPSSELSGRSAVTSLSLYKSWTARQYTSCPVRTPASRETPEPTRAAQHPGASAIVTASETIGSRGVTLRTIKRSHGRANPNTPRRTMTQGG
jgi:hypothetical protein